MLRIILLLALGLTLSGCSFIFGKDTVFRDRGNDYLKATEMPPVEIPGDLDSDTLGMAFPVPPAQQISEYQLAEEFVAPRPNKLTTDQTGQVRIQRLDDEQWILVPAPPGEVWPQVRGFLTENSIPTLRTDAENGVIETRLITDDNEASTSHQFRLHLEQGVQLNTTEIVVLHREFQASELTDPLPQWELGTITDSERGAALRQELAEALAGDEGSGTASLLGQRIGAASKVEIVTPSGADPYILMRLSYARSWASVEYALATESFSISSSTRDDGVFNIVLLSEEAQSDSWLRRMLRRSSRTLGVPYQIHLRQTVDSVEVRITTPEGANLSQRDAFEILTLLRRNLA